MLTNSAYEESTGCAIQIPDGYCGLMVPAQDQWQGDLQQLGVNGYFPLQILYGYSQITLRSWMSYYFKFASTNTFPLGSNVNATNALNLKQGNRVAWIYIAKVEKLPFTCV